MSDELAKAHQAGDAYKIFANTTDLNTTARLSSLSQHGNVDDDKYFTAVVNDKTYLREQ